ncbi:MAG: Gx transporter family protein [Oscillospiraceae bacterium]|nr:Gx transporter family protein [Oscillospiraceae bacterium]
MKGTKKLALCAILLALALALSYTERFLPLQLLIPLPGVKLGLANIVTLVAIWLLPAGETLAIVALRCFMGAIFGGGISGLLFSLTGGLLSLGIMLLSRRLPCFSLYGISILGAAAHNIGQILAAMLLMQTVYIGAYLPYLLLVSLFTGFATGAAAGGVLRILSSHSLIGRFSPPS